MVFNYIFFQLVAIEKNDVEIHFDGWGGAFGYRCRYDSRDLFPVGWCEKNGHPLLPPGKTFQKKNKVLLKLKMQVDPTKHSGQSLII